MKHVLSFAVAFALAALASMGTTEGAMAAGWKLNPALSTVSITSVKKGRVGEAHYFKNIDGGVSAAGDAKVTIHLGSVETGVGIRNKRMGKLLFEIAKFPLATITAKVDAGLGKMAVGSRVKRDLKVHVDLHGIKKDLKAGVYITRISPKAVVVSTAKPMIVKASMFGLAGGVAALQKIAKLPSIATAVPTTFSLMFVQN